MGVLLISNCSFIPIAKFRNQPYFKYDINHVFAIFTKYKILLQGNSDSMKLR
ncbi:hypothetical protein JCM19274_323 [Algibacter lectus]|uniref:Uncharacterized protein n=1 Tax=Algibacter lectus TaxID=221126 RepID=A0A090X1F8_9FLAO|nr:hypothetical protein [Algibacter lectus]GAL81764.1 hypothetical protein JCM19274_323 [Algibacter lectus]